MSCTPFCGQSVPQFGGSLGKLLLIWYISSSTSRAHITHTQSACISCGVKDWLNIILSLGLIKRICVRKNKQIPIQCTKVLFYAG